MTTAYTCPTILAWPDLAIGQSARLALCFSLDDLRRFAELSGDRNPLHLDGSFARSRGFAREVVYGGLIHAQLSRMIGMILLGRDALWISSRIDFREPLLVDEPAELAATVRELSES